MKNISRRNIGGFTLIELLVVVLIIGILSAIALPQYTTVVEKSRLAEALTTVGYMQRVLQINYLETGGLRPDSGYNLGKDIMELSGGEWNEDGTKYCTKNFLYIHDDPWDMMAYRTNNCSTDKKDYRLYFSSSSGADWGDDKECDAYTDLGYKICKTLLSQGYVLEDYRE